MKVTITTLSDDIFTLEAAGDIELENFKALCEFETGIPAREISIMWNGRPLLDEKKTLSAYGINDGDVLLLQQLRGPQGRPTDTPQPPAGAQVGPGGGQLPFIDFSSVAIPGTSAGASHQSAQGGARGGGGVPPGGVPEDPAVLMEMLLSSPHEMSLLKERNPPLADAVLSRNLEKFTEVLNKQKAERAERERERIRMLSADPFDADVQQKIAEEIRLQNVESNMETAMEYAPESFGQVAMLYIDCKVNGHDVKAFVDSGAQMTIMSQKCAERCHIMRLVDTRWAGIAKGVGTQKIIGRVHLCQIQIGPDFLQSSFSILEDQPMDMLLGLDMLKRHQCCIDLKRGTLVIGTTGTETPFLTESDLPDHARLNRTASEVDEGQLQEHEDRELAEALNKSAKEAGLKVKKRR
ncbi:protein DDI1 homolog 2-like isoform X2 [Lingula anatina]|uniref:Protein DDI1 homolog 2-like isoform X2 n=1 Tax=Lingula anatina TaxID=7574 RepID=A0A1S3K2S3_LINAN|nr:protein DDI1 homolog 2-like isoform X2 [Lingula anatina]|eukprot:XP_013416940.1 protein DDI1 homolog 2-like isoform X2 [Lingula anatina]